MNPDERVLIPLSDFNINEQQPGISISFRRIYDAFIEAEEMGSGTETDDKAQRPAKRPKRLKRIERTPSPVEQLL